MVSDAGHWQRLRHFIWSVRQVQKSSVDIYVLDIGLNDQQKMKLREADVRVIQVMRNCDDAIRMPAAFMWKVFADRLVPKADPLIVCDDDLEFREPGVLDELIERAARRLIICEEVYGWVSNVNVRFELKGIGHVKQALLQTDGHYLADYPIVNAGLFGGPRGRPEWGGTLPAGGSIDQFLSLVRPIAGAALDVFHWYWEQLAMCQVVRLGIFDVDILPTEFNWIPHWGHNPRAKVYHFCGPFPGVAGKELRAKVPPKFLHVAPPPSMVRTIKGYKNIRVEMGGRVESKRGPRT